MNVAIFTDNDFDKINGVTTTLTAALRYMPEGLRLRVYTAATLSVDTPDYLAVRSLGMPIPFYRDMRMYFPRLFEFVARARADRIDVIHLTTPGPVGLAALFAAWRLRLPMVGSFHTDLASYTTMLSGSVRLGSLMRWLYGKCVKRFSPPRSIPAACSSTRRPTRPKSICGREAWTRRSSVQPDGLNPSATAGTCRTVVLRCSTSAASRKRSSPMPWPAGAVELRAEFFNLLNRTNFRAPNGNRSAAAFGTITTTYDPRQAQFGMKIGF